MHRIGGLMPAMTPDRRSLALLILAGCSTASTASPESVDAFAAIDGAADGPIVPEASPHLGLGIPIDTSPGDDLLVVHPQFAASYNRYLNEANWVSWRTRPSDFGPAPRYAGPFFPDPLLPSEVFHPDTDIYFGPGYDRGHMLRSEERTDTEAHNIETFVMTNVIPQTADLNRGVWFDFELHVQRTVQSTAHPKDAYVIAGPIFPAACRTHVARTAGDGCPDIGRDTNVGHRVAVPSSTFKIVAFVPAGTPFDPATATVTAVVMPNIDGIANDRWYTYRATVAEIEQLTGYDIPAL